MPRITVARTSADAAVAVDRIACDGRGLCAALLPERIGLDEWGYPVVDPRPLDRGTALEAVRICPVRALYLREEAAAPDARAKAASSGR